MKANSLEERFKCNLRVSKITVRSCRTKIKSNDLPLVTCNPVQPVSGLDDRRVIPPPLIPPRPGMLGLEGRSTLRAMSYRSQRPSSRDNQTHCKPTFLVVAYLAVVLQFDIDDCLEQSKYLAFVNLSYCTCVCVNSTVSLHLCTLQFSGACK